MNNNVGVGAAFCAAYFSSALSVGSLCSLNPWWPDSNPDSAIGPGGTLNIVNFVYGALVLNEVLWSAGLGIGGLICAAYNAKEKLGIKAIVGSAALTLPAITGSIFASLNKPNEYPEPDAKLVLMNFCGGLNLSLFVCVVACAGLGVGAGCFYLFWKICKCLVDSCKRMVEKTRAGGQSQYNSLAQSSV